MSSPGLQLGTTERGVMVIKSKDKTRARQRKGALSNWKKTGKTVIKYLKKRGISGDDLRYVEIIAYKLYRGGGGSTTRWRLVH